MTTSVMIKSIKQKRHNIHTKPESKQFSETYINMHTVFKYKRTKVNISTDHTDELGQRDHELHGHQF